MYDLPNQKLKELHNYVETCLNGGQMNLNNQNGEMKQFMDNQQLLDSNGMLQNQMDIQNQMQQMYNLNNNYFMPNQFEAPNIGNDGLQDQQNQLLN